LAPLLVREQWRSRNWSGYAVARAGITGASGTWTVAQVQTPTTRRQIKGYRYSSTWVGVDGFNNSSLIQAGTEQDWLHGHAFYQAWWEILPAAEVPIASIAVHPGDTMSVSITKGTLDWTIAISDTTTRQSFLTVQPYGGPANSAEWIQEAPTIGRRVATLAAESNVVFALAKVNGVGAGLVSSEAGAMYKGRTAISTPSSPSPTADGFAVAYGGVAPPAP